MIQLLDYYMAFTRDHDWEEGGHGAIVYQSLTKTALDLGVSERQIQRLEKALAEVGAITWNDSGNHRRYGSRCKVSGRILFGFGVDLTPLAALREHLREKLEEKRLYDAAWMETKRQVSWYRAQIRRLLAELEIREEGPSDDFDCRPTSIPIRTQMNLEDLRSLLRTHKTLYERLENGFQSEMSSDPTPSQASKESSRGDENVAHKQYTNNQKSNKFDTDCRPSAIGFQEGKLDHPEPKEEERIEAPPENILVAAGLDKITLKQVLNAASERFRARIPLHRRPMNANDLVEAAFSLKSELKISQKSWAQACQSVDRLGAAICLVLTDQASQRLVNPVRTPGAYFRALANRAESGDLNVHASIMKILKRENEA